VRRNFYTEHSRASGLLEVMILLMAMILPPVMTVLTVTTVFTVTILLTVMMLLMVATSCESFPLCNFLRSSVT
jgi:hypothetical protein